jgi:hypothetical protein
LKPEPLASRKVVDCEVGTEGSDPAKVCTDEQKVHKRLIDGDKCPQQHKVQRMSKPFFSRCAGDRRKEKALTGGGLSDYGIIPKRSQQRP